MKYLFAALLLLFLLLYMLSRGRFVKEMGLLDSRKDRLACLIPVGLMVMSLLRRKSVSLYERRLQSKLRELHGDKDYALLLRLFMARKILFTMLALLFVMFTGIMSEPDYGYALFGISLAAASFMLPDRQLEGRVKERRRSIQLDFGEFLNKLVLLVNAGLTVHGAMERIAREAREATPFYVELRCALQDISSGRPVIQAYEDLAKRCRLQEVTLFVTTLIQNSRRGTSEFVPVLRLQMSACWENRKNLARRLGEEASTKLLVPTSIVFVAILIMIMAPAVFQLKI